ncbi:MAG: phytanoyl-CoA dioxygenase family protein [Terrimicrobiaceae bacterium]
MRRQPKDTTATDQFLWPDLPGATERLVAGEIPHTTGTDILTAWSRDGYAILDQAAAGPAPDGFLRDMQAALNAPESDIKMTYWDETGHHFTAAKANLLHNKEAKVLDLHTRLASAHELIFAPAILDFLTDVFQDDAVAFQSLYFENGSQQGSHQDTAFVYVEPPYQFAASWIALEDIVPGTGELFYYPGSHKMDDLIFAQNTKALRPGDPDGPGYSASLEQIVTEHGLERKLLHIPKGTALMWAADLVHGGAPIQTPHTRRSLVTHYAPKSTVIPYQPDPGRPLREVRKRGWVVGAH